MKESTCKKLFIYEVFSTLLRFGDDTKHKFDRLSYKERLLDVVPAVFHKFIPDAPKPAFKWDAKRSKDKDAARFREVCVPFCVPFVKIDS